MWYCLENFSRKISSTVGLFISDCGTFAQIFLEKFSLASPKNLRKLCGLLDSLEPLLQYVHNALQSYALFLFPPTSLSLFCVFGEMPLFRVESTSKCKTSAKL